MFRITWLGQGGFFFKIEDQRICVDPYLSNSLFEREGGKKFDRMVPIPIYPADLEADLVISTHDHIDHLDQETVKAVSSQTILYAGPQSCIQQFMSVGVPANRLRNFDRGHSMQMGVVHLEAVYADHSVDSIGVVLKGGGYTLYLTGDSLFTDRLIESAQKYEPDILIVCINGKLGNMHYPEAARLARLLKVKAAAPCHYGMFAENTEDPINFEKKLEGSGIKYFEFQHNVPVSIDQILP